MNFFGKVMKGFLIIGLAMLAGRIVTAIFRYVNTTFFTDYHVISLLILVIGIIGTEFVNDQKRKGRK